MKKILLCLLLAVQVTAYGQFPELAKTPYRDGSVFTQQPGVKPLEIRSYNSKT